MTAVTGPSQTTKGIWLANARRLEGLFVMDVEGTDSTERGGQALDYERKTALFSLALSEVVLVNLWSHDIGRQNAANLPLLKMVFEVNLHIFQESDAPKTILLFVIRDHVSSTTSLEVLSERIMKDMNALWAQIAKPVHWQNAAATDVFDFQFNSLAHFVLEPDNFERDCNALQERFYNPKHKKYLFKRAHPKTIISGGFADYAKGIWETILENRNLDLPSQKQVLSLHRCTDTLNQAYNMFLEDWRALLATCADGRYVPHFELELSNMCKRTFGLYDAVTQGYHPEVRERKAEELRGKVAHDLKQLVEAHMVNAARVMRERFRAKFDGAGNMAEAKEAGLAAGPDPRALGSPDVDPVVVQVCRNPYADARARFLADVETECLRAMLQESERKRTKAEEQAQQALRDLEKERLEGNTRSAAVIKVEEELNRANEARRKDAEQLQARTRELQDALEIARQHKQAANAAAADVQRLTDEMGSTRRLLENENRTLREEFEVSKRKAAEAERGLIQAKDEAKSDRDRCQELERRIADVSEAVTTQARAIIALQDEKNTVCDALAKKNAFYSQKAEETQETLSYYEKIIAGNRDEMLDLRDKLAAAADYGENTGANYRKAVAEMEELRKHNADLFNENQYLIQLLNQKQSEFYEEYRRNLHERQLMAARLDDLERMKGGYMPGPPIVLGGPVMGPQGGVYEGHSSSSHSTRRKVTMDSSMINSSSLVSGPGGGGGAGAGGSAGQGGQGGGQGPAGMMEIRGGSTSRHRNTTSDVSRTPSSSQPTPSKKN
jgi:hypothetical protein